MLGLYSPEKILRIHHTPMCTPVHIHPPAHSRALSCIYMHTHIPAHSRAHLCTPAPTCIHPPTPTPTCPQRHMPAHSPANTHPQVHIREHPCTPNYCKYGVYYTHDLEILILVDLVECKATIDTYTKS